MAYLSEPSGHDVGMAGAYDPAPTTNGHLKRSRNLSHYENEYEDEENNIIGNDYDDDDGYGSNPDVASADKVSRAQFTPFDVCLMIFLFYFLF